MNSFEQVLSSASEDVQLSLRGHEPVEWADFLLNPRRLRGSDFLMRWSQGVWSEERVTEAVNASEEFYAMPYGPSGTAPNDDPREFELYFERLDEANPNSLKRPDLLVFTKAEQGALRGIVESLGGIRNLPFVSETDSSMRRLLDAAVLAVECETSLWRARRMPDYGKELRPMRRLGGKPGLPQNAVLPTVIVKEEDRARLRDWQEKAGVRIHVWHLFFDLAFGVPLDRVEELIAEGLILPTVQTFQAPGGAVQKKPIYKVYYQHAYKLGEAREDPVLRPDYVEDANGHILPFVKFDGGALDLSREAVEVLRAAASTRRGRGR